MHSNQKLAKSESSYKKTDLRFIKDVIFSAVGPTVLKFRSFLFIPLLIRTLGIDGYGVWIQFEITSLLLVTIASLNFGLAMNRFLAGNLSVDQISDDVSSILTLQLSLAVALSLPILLFSRWFGNFVFGAPVYSTISICLVFSVLAQIVGNVFWALMRAQRHNKEIAGINTLRWLGEFIVILVVSITTQSLINLFIVFAIYQILINGVYPLFTIYKKWYYIKFPKFSRIKKYLKFSLPLFGNTIGWWIVTSSDRYLIKWFLGIDAVGIYSAIYKFGNLMMLIVVPLAEVLLPDMAASYDQGKIIEMKRRLNLTLKYFALISALVVLGISGVAPLIIAISGGLPNDIHLVTTILVFIGLSSIFFGLGRILLDALSVKEQTLHIGVLWLVLAAINIVINLIMIPVLGITGAAISVMLTYTVALVIIHKMVKHFYSQLHMWDGWAFQSISFLGISLVIGWEMIVKLQPVFLLAPVFSIATFSMLLLTFRIISVGDVKYIFSTVKRNG